MAIPQVPGYGVMPDVPGLTQAQAKRIGMETYLMSTMDNSDGGEIHE